MTDREEREEHIKRLEAALACEEKQFSGKCSKQTCDDNCALLYEQGNWGEWKETLRYAINSLKTDLKYDLLYEETSGQADKSTTKNNLGVDCISRKAVLDAIDTKAWEFCDYLISKGRNDEQKPVSHFADNLRECVREELPSVTPQEPQSFKWCDTCKEYDQEKHCCHRYSKVIRDTVAEIEQEPILDKIRAEIDKIYEREGSSFDCLNALDELKEFIDKYKVESET